MRCVGLLADSARWEATALELLEAAHDLTVLKRCVDVDDLMGSVTTGQLDVAVVAGDVAGLDQSAVAHMTRYGCVVIAVLDGGHPEVVPQRLARAGVVHLLDVGAIDQLPALVREVGLDVPDSFGETEQALDQFLSSQQPRHGDDGAARPRGRVLAVWGPVGAPGRTTVATGLAGLLAARGRPTIIVDADRHASVAQHLGVMDQVSGLLSASRLLQSGAGHGMVSGACRALTPQLGVLTGLPRPDRRDEVPAGALSAVVEEIATFADVVLDLGHDLDADVPPGSAGCWTTELLEAADDVVVVGAADPVGLTRLAHALVELTDACGELGVRVLINRTRPTLGWSEKEMAEVVGRFAPIRALHFVPDDRAAVDRALVHGDPVTSRPAAVTTALGAVLDAVRPETVQTAGPARARRLALRVRGTTPLGSEHGAKVPGQRSPAAREHLLRLRTAGRGRPQ